MVTNKQTAITQYLDTVECATKKELLEKVARGWYYHNGSKHLGDVLTRMVRRRKIIRVSRGVYALKAKSLAQPKTAIDLFNQPRLK